MAAGLMWRGRPRPRPLTLSRKLAGEGARATHSPEDRSLYNPLDFLCPLTRRLNVLSQTQCDSGCVDRWTFSFCSSHASGPSFSVSFPKSRSEKPLDGRIFLLLSNDPSAEPRMQIDDSVRTQMIFGMDVDGMQPGQAVVVDDSAAGYPIRSSARCAARRLLRAGGAASL